MISNRCSNRNLVNHLIQTNKISDFEVNYVYEKSDYGREWMCVLTYTSLDNPHQHISNSNTKRNALNKIIIDIEPELRDLAGIKI